MNEDEDFLQSSAKAIAKHMAKKLARVLAQREKAVNLKHRQLAIVLLDACVSGYEYELDYDECARILAETFPNL